MGFDLLGNDPFELIVSRPHCRTSDVQSLHHDFAHVDADFWTSQESNLDQSPIKAKLVKILVHVVPSDIIQYQVNASFTSLCFNDAIPVFISSIIDHNVSS